MREYSDTKAQLSLSVLEVALGVLFVFAVLSGIILGVPTPEHRAPQLDTYAHDVATVLDDPSNQHRLSEVARSPSAFARGHTALSDRLDRLLSDNLMARIETPHGTVGYQLPAGVPVGRATILTKHGRVRILVWYV